MKSGQTEFESWGDAGVRDFRGQALGAASRIWLGQEAKLRVRKMSNLLDPRVTDPFHLGSHGESRRAENQPGTCNKTQQNMASKRKSLRSVGTGSRGLRSRAVKRGWPGKRWNFRKLGRRWWVRGDLCWQENISASGPRKPRTELREQTCCLHKGQASWVAGK